VADFFLECQKLQPSWYRVDSLRNQEILGDNNPAFIPPLSKLFGMRNELTNDLLLACGLLYKHGKQLRVSRDSRNDLRHEFSLDIEFEQKTYKLVGS